MNVNIKIEFDHRRNYYRLIVKDENDEKIPFVAGRVYEDEHEAEMAAALMKLMFDKVENRKDFDINLFDFNIRAIFRLIDADGKW